MDQLCPACLAFSGSFDKNKACCQIRMIAGLPKLQRMGVYTAYGNEHGAEALQVLREKVKVEYDRKQGAKK